DLMIGGLSGWSDTEAHRINFVYNTASSPTIFTTIESEYVSSGSMGKLHFRNIYNGGPQTGYVMTLQGDGNVGIGTASPNAALEIEGDTKYISIKSADYPNVYLGHAGGGALLDEGILELKDDGVTDIRLWAGGDSFINTGGKVGIGTTNPQAALNVSGTNKNIQLGSTAAVATTAEVRHIFAGAGAFIGQDAPGEANIGNNLYYNNAFKRRSAKEAANIRFNAGITYFQSAATGAADSTITWANNMTILNDGSVGIGKVDPGYKLDVIGEYGAKMAKFTAPSAQSLYLYGDGGGVGITATDPYTNSALIYLTESDTINFYTGSTNRMVINSSGYVGIDTPAPNSKLTIGTDFASVAGLTIDTGGASDSGLVMRQSASNPAFGILPHSSQIYFSAGVYYDGGSWVQHSDTDDNLLFVLDPGQGAKWYASDNGSGSWNVASDQQLWNANGNWSALVQSTKSGNSYFTGGDVGIGTAAPIKPLTVHNHVTQSLPLGVYGDVDGVNTYTGIEFGYRGDGTSYDKGAIVFEGLDGQGR
ncbi:hypothetical protein ACFL57_05580, partial [Candidatus Margulisiibacteriota bacterium]